MRKPEMQGVYWMRMLVHALYDYIFDSGVMPQCCSMTRAILS